jgi:hypothetical protein
MLKVGGSLNFVTSVVTVFLIGLCQACGGSDCTLPVTSVDPSGQWKGTLVRRESDCGSNTRGIQFSFDHFLSLQCVGNDDSQVYLLNEDNIEFKETSYSLIGGGSFSVESLRDNETIDISYDNFDGSLADVTEKIRRYSNGKILCSEKYEGQARR